MRSLLPLAQARRQTHDTDVRGDDMPAWEAAEALASPAKMLNRMGVRRKRGQREGGVHSGWDHFWFFS